MFKCYFCEQTTPPKTTRHRVVIEKREKKYSVRRREAKRGRFRDRDVVQDRGGEGMEIMKEVDACPTCAAKPPEPVVVAAPEPESHRDAETTEEHVAEAR